MFQEFCFPYLVFKPNALYNKSGRLASKSMDRGVKENEENMNILLQSEKIYAIKEEISRKEFFYE